MKFIPDGEVEITQITIEGEPITFIVPCFLVDDLLCIRKSYYLKDNEDIRINRNRFILCTRIWDITVDYFHRSALKDWPRFVNNAYQYGKFLQQIEQKQSQAKWYYTNHYAELLRKAQILLSSENNELF